MHDRLSVESNSHRPSPVRVRVQSALNELHLKYRDLADGRIASYIPELARALPETFSICVVTAGGELVEVGDVERRFTVQSVSKPFVYGLALHDRGRDEVLERVGVEPTGDAFNSIIKLDATNRAHNPCVNAGAIATTSLIRGSGPTERLNRVLDAFQNFVGHPVDVDMSVYISERTSGHRNRAIAHLMLNFGMIDENVEQILDLYFQQCSILVNCRDLAVMGATLANGGINPLTGVRAVEEEYIRDILTVMYTCGMYDYAGQWAYDVGLPAKSGVSGGILAVVPGQYGIGVYSPPLDSRGNSVRGIRVCEELSQNIGMHALDAALTGSAGQRESTGKLDSRILAAIHELHHAYKDDTEGKVAAYIPELAKANPDAFGIAVVTARGELYTVGDIESRFTLQSISNVFTYGLVLDALGREQVRSVVGVEPTGNPFNAIVLDPQTNRPMNPMVNAGAIAVASLVPGADATARLNGVLETLGRYLGERPGVNMEVYISERSTGDRNRSIAYLMRNFDVLWASVDESLDLYFQACSVQVNCRELALMAATLANAGVHPRTGTTAITRPALRDVLSIMSTCGLNEASGQWMHSVGIPAKSGVGGGLLAVAPGHLGLAVYSPRIDASGNSVRGMKVTRDLSRMLGLHLFQSPIATK